MCVNRNYTQEQYEIEHRCIYESVAVVNDLNLKSEVEVEGKVELFFLKKRDGHSIFITQHIDDLRKKPDNLV